MDNIQVSGARIHNLKHINVTLPKGKFIVFTGVSGSGKSSLAFDVLYEEGRQRYLQSIGLNLRGESIEEIDPFDEIIGLPPAIAVEQNKIRQSNPRSIVGTKTKALHDLKWLYSLDGRGPDDKRTHLSPDHFAFHSSAVGRCADCDGRGYSSNLDINKIIQDPNRTVSKIVSNISTQLDKYLMKLMKEEKIDWRHAIYADLPDDIKNKVLRGVESYEGIMNFIIGRMRRKPESRAQFEQAWCSKSICETCLGKRLSNSARHTYIGGKDISELCEMTMSELDHFFRNLGHEKSTYSALGQRTIDRLSVLFRLFTEVGLSHLTLLRSIPTLSGGELQRLYLMYHLESKFDSLLYVFDEPTAGLHESEKQSLLNKLKQLTYSGNTVIVVEHDIQVIKQADYIVELGPSAGKQGGEVLFQGTLENYLQSECSVLSPYIAGHAHVPSKSPDEYRPVTDSTKKLIVRNANLHNLKNLTAEIPLGVMVGVSGVSGSGKSTLIMDTLVPLLKRSMETVNYEVDEDEEEAPSEDSIYEESDTARIEGAEYIQKCVLVSQKIIGRGKGSTPAAYIGIWDKVRSIFAGQPEAVAANYTASHFSFNTEQGCCPSCRGAGVENIDMGAIGIVNRRCTTCNGSRFKKEILDITYQDKNIWDVLEMNAREALEFFREHRAISLMLQTLIQVGLDYLPLGQPVPTLSGGEAQRIKLAKELGKARKDNTLYILDEPTTGLSSPDIAKLMTLLEGFVEQGNSVIIVEHETSLLSYCDWVIDMGPGGGSEGGEIVTAGPPYSKANFRLVNGDDS
ncbi:ATP-binding cassette domain-containing protein [Paenibacillus mesophilus]|uniref:ATP-binding cassette domain-containing protein n=1 Tax=Paenibacillus mesophilus TaxID=2582849 RepID=UPI00110EB309|nr:ATP-binding cassette domain-containing protein [Paenibacillus mesophilus]TMV43899.1 ATP-binding cassette domain-containing protein [Paenibacillus mesophilus]